MTKKNFTEMSRPEQIEAARKSAPDATEAELTDMVNAGNWVAANIENLQIGHLLSCLSNGLPIPFSVYCSIMWEKVGRKEFVSAN